MTQRFHKRLLLFTSSLQNADLCHLLVQRMLVSIASSTSYAHDELGCSALSTHSKVEGGKVPFTRNDVSGSQPCAGWYQMVYYRFKLDRLIQIPSHYEATICK